VTPAPVNNELQARVLQEGEAPVTCRPADLIEPEMKQLTGAVKRLAEERGIRLADNLTDDVLIYAQFPQVGLKFLENRDNPDAFEPAPGKETAPAPATAAPATGGVESYHVTVDGKGYEVTVATGGTVSGIQPQAAAAPTPAATGAGGQAVPAPLAGSIHKVNVAVGQRIAAGDVVMILEAMKMETEVRAPAAGTVASVSVREGDVVQVGDTLLTLS
jgi:oxaloacetate decarboxylase alpha subunit